MNKPVKQFYLLLCLFLAGTGYAVGQYLPLNESGKCELAEVVVAEGFLRSALLENATNWAKGLTKTEGKLTSVVKDSIEGKLGGNFEFTVYSQTGILKKVSGSITYHFAIETKDGKYRYSFSDFVFHYYKQDRNYQMVRTGRTKPLEEPNANGWQKLWTQHRGTVYALTSHQLEELKTKIIEVQNATNSKPPEKKVDW